MIEKKLVSIVVSAYNEEGNVNELYQQLLKNLIPLTDKINYEIIFVNDGSKDNTLKVLRELVKKEEKVKVYNFFRNFGHEVAMIAGMNHADGDAVIFMDCDLQHPPALVPVLIQKWLDGYEVVLTKRLKNEHTTKFYKLCSKLFYYAINLMSEVYVPSDTPDFRLINRKYVNILRNIKETDGMFRNTIRWIGFNADENMTSIEFKAEPRFSGKTNYNFLKLINLAIDGIMQFSTKPLRILMIIAVLGAFLNIIALILFFFKVIEFSSFVICTFFTLNSVGLSIVAEYIAKIHIAVKHRPAYFGEVIKHSNKLTD